MNAIDWTPNGIRLYSLNEATLLPFFADGLLCRPVVLLSVRPILAVTRGILDRVAEWMLNIGRARHVVDLVPELKPYVAWPRRLYFREAFARVEPWQDRYYRFDDAGDCDGALHTAFKSVTCQVVYDRVFDIHAIDALRRAFPGTTLDFTGVLADTVDMYRDIQGPGSLPPDRRRMVVRAAVNLIGACFAATWASAWILRRTRPAAPQKPVFCVLDVLGNRAESYVRDEIEDGGPILLMDRRRHSSDGEWSVNDHRLRCRWGDGCFALAGALVALAVTWRDTIRLWRRHRALASGHFVAVALLPSKRAKWRALFNLYRPRHYLGRDEYNPDHILRSDELRRIGARSHGWSGAIYSAFTRVAPNARYVDFDCYYAVGSRLCDEYQDKWPSGMTISSIGTFGYPRQRLESRWPMGNAILVASRIAFSDPRFARMVRRVAEAFPDRRIILQVKRVMFLDRDARAELVGAIIGDLANVQYAEDNIYDLLEQAACLVSDISTLPGEAICLGIPTFVVDLVDQEYCRFREFPGLCVEDAEELVARVSAALRSSDYYPLADYRRRMGLDGPPAAFDALRRGMGLGAREIPVRNARSA